MMVRERLAELLRRDATLMFWVNSQRYGFCALPRIASERYERTTVFDARWLCFGVNLSLVDEDNPGLGRPST